jgi:hypothetical protein
LRKPQIRAEVDKRIKEKIIGKDDLLALITSVATMDVTDYTRADGTLDVQAMGEDGLGHLVVGVKPGREGPEVTLANPQTSRKMLARYHRLLGSDVSVDVNATATLDKDTLTSLVEQVTAASTQTETETDPESEQDDA